MKKLWKYTLGFFTFVGGILLSVFVLGSNKNKRVKELKGKIKDNKKKTKAIDKKIKSVSKLNKNVNKSIANKKKALAQIEKDKKGFKAKSVGADDAADFLKKYSKSKRKKSK